MTTCEKIAGQWAHDKDMNPATNLISRTQNQPWQSAPAP